MCCWFINYLSHVFLYIAMSKKTRSIKQTGCSKQKTRSNLRKRRQISGGDAYNVMPARSIYPLNDYAVDPQRMMRGGSKSRKYLYRGGESNGWTPSQPVSTLFGTNNRYLV